MSTLRQLIGRIASLDTVHRPRHVRKIGSGDTDLAAFGRCICAHAIRCGEPPDRRSLVQQAHHANVRLVNGQPGGVELDRVWSPVEILGQMTADSLRHVAGLET